MNLRLLAAMPLVLGSIALAYGQNPAAPTVVGRGQAEIKKDPELLRLQVEVVVRGKDLKDALDKLKERRGELVKKLAELEAVKDSVEFGAPSVSADKTARQLAMERMMMERGRYSPPVRQPPKVKTPDPVFVAMTLKADWALGGTAEELLLKAQTLQERIKAADLGGLKALDAQATPAELEIQEEMRNDRDDGPRRGEPTFLYVAKLKDAERDQALARAFQDARTHAERSAKAASASLGALAHLESDTQPVGFGNNGDDDSYRFQRYRGGMIPNTPEPTKGEVVGFQPGQLMFRFGVSASFLLK